MVVAVNPYMSGTLTLRLAAMLRLFSNSRRRPDHAASVYAAIVAAARNRLFYARLGVPDTLDGRFEVLAIMLHAVVRRLVHGSDPDIEFSRRITEHFIVDMDSNLREMGVSDVRVAKKIKTLYSAYGGRIAAYDIALASGGDALEKAVARNIFMGGPPDGATAALAAYIQSAEAMLESVPTADITVGRVRFPDPAVFIPAAAATPQQAS
jgi:cytochrome b pre-mRNA-processing protein 3